MCEVGRERDWEFETFEYADRRFLAKDEGLWPLVRLEDGDTSDGRAEIDGAEELSNEEGEVITAAISAPGVTRKEIEGSRATSDHMRFSSEINQD